METKKLRTETSASRLVRVLGGLDRAVEISGYSRRTWQYWIRSGFIPSRRQRDIFRRGVAAGSHISPLDFVFDMMVTAGTPSRADRTVPVESQEGE